MGCSNVIFSAEGGIQVFYTVTRRHAKVDLREHGFRNSMDSTSEGQFFIFGENDKQRK